MVCRANGVRTNSRTGGTKQAKEPAFAHDLDQRANGGHPRDSDRIPERPLRPGEASVVATWPRPSQNRFSVKISQPASVAVFGLRRIGQLSEDDFLRVRP